MFSDLERSVFYQAQGLSPAHIQEFEEMRLNSPARKISQRGLKNTIVDFFSIKNNARRKLESYTVEFLYALELEVLGDCHEYYVQVEPKNIVRNGRTSSMTADFLLYAPDGLRLVECKPRQKLEALAAKRPEEWVCEQGTWTRPPVHAWAAERRSTYSIWSPPAPHGIYQGNLMVLYGHLSAGGMKRSEQRYIDRLIRLLGRGPRTIQAAMAAIPRLSAAHAVEALTRRLVYGTLKSVPLNEVDRFTLYLVPDQAVDADERLLAELADATSQPDVTSRLLLASPGDYEKGKQRLERVQRMLAGEEPQTARYRRLVRHVLEARAKGESELEVCLTNFANCGRRSGQLTESQDRALVWAVTQYRSNALVRTIEDAHDALVLRCREQEIRPPSRTTLSKRIGRVNPLVRAYTEGGYRAYHAVEPAIDPADRTLRCFTPGLVAHIDSTKLDGRLTPEFWSALGFDCPTIYVAMDSCGENALGRALMFGPSCRNALAVLLRDVLFRQGCLPRYWIADGGSEYIGAWFEAFCSLTASSRIQPPPGAPRRNSLAENALGRVNAELAHRFLGSTAPDKQGRAVTSRQKSYATACHRYQTIVEHLDRYLFEDMPSVPLGVSRCDAREKCAGLTERFGELGSVRVQNMDEFHIATSIPLERDVKSDPIRGIRYLQRTYSSAELMRQIRTHRPSEMRLDCVNPRRMYVRFPSGWVLATNSNHLVTAGRSDLEHLFESMTDHIARRENRSIRKEKRIERTRRLQEANEQAGSTKHLMTQLPSAPAKHEQKDESHHRLWSLGSDRLFPFPTDGEE